MRSERRIYSNDHSKAFVSAGGYIFDLETHPECRRQGYGRDVMQEIIADADRNQQKLTAHVPELLHPLYRSMGFEISEETMSIGQHLPLMVREPKSGS